MKENNNRYDISLKINMYNVYKYKSQMNNYKEILHFQLSNVIIFD